MATKSMARTKKGMAADIRKSLDTMGLEHIDLYQLHNVKSSAELDQVLNPDGCPGRPGGGKKSRPHRAHRHHGATSRIFCWKRYR
ncbi:MAG: hypothetical protein RQM92_02270 [Candidatus Syntrophopropionicum ammoniitolerans]